MFMVVKLQNNNQQWKTSGTHCYTDYVSNWSDIICSIWGLVSAYLAVNPNSSDRLYRFSNGLNSIAPTWSIGVAGAFWVSFTEIENFFYSFLLVEKYYSTLFQCLLPADRQTLDLVSLHQHAALAILTFADLLITNSKISLKLIVPGKPWIKARNNWFQLGSSLLCMRQTQFWYGSFSARSVMKFTQW